MNLSSLALSSTLQAAPTHAPQCSLLVTNLKRITNNSTEQNTSFLYNQWSGMAKSSDGLEPAGQYDAHPRQQNLNPNSSFLYGPKASASLGKAPVAAEPNTHALFHGNAMVSIGSGHKSEIDSAPVLQANSFESPIDERYEGSDIHSESDSYFWSDGESDIGDIYDFDDGYMSDSYSPYGEDITSELQQKLLIKTNSVFAEPEIPKAQLSMTDTIINTFVAAQETLNQLDISNAAPAFDRVKAMIPKVADPYCIEIIQAIQSAIKHRLKAAESFAINKTDAPTLKSDISDRAYANALPYRLDFLYQEMRTLEAVAAQLKP